MGVEKKTLSAEKQQAINAKILSAVKRCDAEQVKNLLDQGAEADYAGSSGWTLLYYCTDIETARVLIANGANVRHLNHSQTSPLHRFASDGRTGIVKLLVFMGANISQKDIHNDTALIWAARNNRVDTVEFLLQEGADPEDKGDKGLNALEWATAKKCNEVVEFMQKSRTLKAKLEESEEKGDEISEKILISEPSRRVKEGRKTSVGGSSKDKANEQQDNVDVHVEKDNNISESAEHKRKKESKSPRESKKTSLGKGKATTVSEEKAVEETTSDQPPVIYTVPTAQAVTPCASAYTTPTSSTGSAFSVPQIPDTHTPHMYAAHSPVRDAISNLTTALRAQLTQDQIDEQERMKNELLSAKEALVESEKAREKAQSEVAVLRKRMREADDELKDLREVQKKHKKAVEAVQAAARQAASVLR